MPIRLKVEINTPEIEAADPAAEIPFSVVNPWFSGESAVLTFSREEMLATKLRALLQRDKGRDLLDLAHAITVFEGLDEGRVVEYLGHYHVLSDQTISEAQTQERMFAIEERGLKIPDADFVCLSEGAYGYPRANGVWREPKRTAAPTRLDNFWYSSSNAGTSPIRFSST